MKTERVKFFGLRKESEEKQGIPHQEQRMKAGRGGGGFVFMGDGIDDPLVS